MAYTKIADIGLRGETLKEHLAAFPFSVFISEHPDDHRGTGGGRVSRRHAWLSALPGGTLDFKPGVYGWIYGENAEGVYRYRYIFKDANTAMEFKLRFG